MGKKEYKVRIKGLDDTNELIEEARTIADWYKTHHWFHFLKIERLRYDNPKVEFVIEYVHGHEGRPAGDREVYIDMTNRIITKRWPEGYAKFEKDELEFFDRLNFNIDEDQQKARPQDISEWV